MINRILIVDALGAGSGQRRSSRDSIGCGPRTVAGIFEKLDIATRIIRAEDFISKKGILQGFNHLAISAMTMDFPATHQVVKRLRRGFPQGRILIGGPLSANA